MAGTGIHSGREAGKCAGIGADISTDLRQPRIRYSTNAGEYTIGSNRAECRGSLSRQESREGDDCKEDQKKFHKKAYRSEHNQPGYSMMAS
jgi:hypothetical protein